MQVIFGTRNDILIANHDNGQMTLRTFESHWFSGETSERTVTFPISSLVDITFDEPVPFIKGKVIFELDDNDRITRKLHFKVSYRNRDRVSQLVRYLQHKIYFT